MTESQLIAAGATSRGVNLDAVRDALGTPPQSAQDAPKTNKYRNKKVEICGHKFDSQREAKRYLELGAMQKSGLICDLQLQVKYDLRVNGILIATYKADFVYAVVEDGEMIREVVEDVKGYPNDRWPMKKKLMKACHNIDIVEI